MKERRKRDLFVYISQPSVPSCSLTLSLCLSPTHTDTSTLSPSQTKATTHKRHTIPLKCETPPNIIKSAQHTPVTHNPQVTHTPSRNTIVKSEKISAYIVEIDRERKTKSKIIK